MPSKKKGLGNAGAAGYLWYTTSETVLKNMLNADFKSGTTTDTRSVDALTPDGLKKYSAAYDTALEVAINNGLSGKAMPKVGLADEVLTSLMQIATVGGVGYLVWKKFEESKSFF